MCAILILLIISIQFAIGYFSVKYLSELNEKVVTLDKKVWLVKSQIKPKFEYVRNAFVIINNVIEKYIKHQNKIVLYKNLMLIKSFVVAVILYKKRKSLISFFSLYDIISKFAKALMEF